MRYAPNPAIRTAVWALAAAALLLAAAIRAARAEDPPSGTAPATQPPDKWQYTLFNPVPDDLLRDMDTDRPNKTNTPHTIDAGHLQIETGLADYTYYLDRYQGVNARFDTLALGQLNFRLGVLNDLELNAVVNAYDFQWTKDETGTQSTRQDGLGDTVLGGKLNFWGNDGADDTWATALAIQPQLKVPSARSDLGNGHPELFVGFPFLINVPAQFHLGLETVASWERSADNTVAAAGWQNSVSADRVIFEKFDVYLEYWDHANTQRHQEAQQTVDVGVTYPIGRNVVLDTGVNFGLNKASATVEWLAGISIRF